MSVLDDAARIHPDEWWWIKADGADLFSGLGTSVRGVWSGDVDLADGKLQISHRTHQDQIESLHSIGGKRESHVAIAHQLGVVKQQLVDDVDFVFSSKCTKLNTCCRIELCVGLQLTAKKYSEKQREGKSSEKLMFALAWDVEELERLDRAGRKLAVDCECLSEKFLSL